MVQVDADRCFLIATGDVTEPVEQGWSTAMIRGETLVGQADGEVVVQRVTQWR